MSTLSAHDSMVLLVDMQTGLLPAIADQQALVHAASRLLQAAKLLGVPVIATEHWSEKIGATDPALRRWVDHVVHKRHFNATREAHFLPELPPQREKVLLIGTEAHVCVLQTGLGLASLGLTPVLVTDCIGSRKAADAAAACVRWDHYGLERVTAEMAVFEWLETPAHPQFKEVLRLLKSE